MLFSVEAGNNSLHGMFQAFKLGGNYALVFVIFSLFWDTVKVKEIDSYNPEGGRNTFLRNFL
jgi:hypothetical protein